jgi:hypothetical protein
MLSLLHLRSVLVAFLNGDNGISGRRLSWRSLTASGRGNHKNSCQASSGRASGGDSSVGAQRDLGELRREAAEGQAI